MFRTRTALIAALALGLAAPVAADAQVFIPPGAGAPPPSLTPPPAEAPAEPPATSPDAAAQTGVDTPADTPADTGSPTPPQDDATPPPAPPAAGSAPAQAKPSTSRRLKACAPVKRTASAKRKRAARRRCAAARRAAAKRAGRTVTLHRQAIFGYLGSAACTAGSTPTMYVAPPAVSSDVEQWIEHWNGFSYWNGMEFAGVEEWVGPFYSLPAYPHWFWYGGQWYQESEWGGYSQHIIGVPGARANAVQYVHWYTTGETVSRLIATDGCAGTTGYFGQ